MTGISFFRCRWLLVPALWIGLCGALPAATVYTSDAAVPIRGEADRLLAADWARRGLPLPRQATDAVWARRAWIGLLGRLPTPEEASAFAEDRSPDKADRLLDRLLADPGFADYWSLKWCDVLRVKSEFPINLWPNAVYGYWRRVRRFLAENESAAAFAWALLTAEGSNFRTPEVNFLRATADRSPEGMARAAALTFLNLRLEERPEAERRNWAAFFEDVAFKSSREWKEEIVWRREMPARTLTLPDGRKAALPAGGDARAVLADFLAEPESGFAEAIAGRVWYWLFGRELGEVNPALLKHLAAEFAASGYDFRRLCRLAAGTAAFRAAPFQPEGGAAAAGCFAAFPLRRLDAEVLDDAIADLTGVPSRYSSVIPEPFSFLPPEARTVTLADGSINSSFLLLFGRPARDSGRLEERQNRINAKQRLYLFNSGELFRKLGRMPQQEALKRMRPEAKIDRLYRLFFARPPTPDELRTVRQAYEARPKGAERWRFWQDLCWILVNSGEFLYQH